MLRMRRATTGAVLGLVALAACATTRATGAERRVMEEPAVMPESAARAAPPAPVADDRTLPPAPPAPDAADSASPPGERTTTAGTTTESSPVPPHELLVREFEPWPPRGAELVPRAPATGPLVSLPFSADGVRALDLVERIAAAAEIAITFDAEAAPALRSAVVTRPGPALVPRSRVIDVLRAALFPHGLLAERRDLGTGDDAVLIHAAGCPLSLRYAATYVPEQEVPGLADEEGLFIVTTLRVRDVVDAGRLRQALTPLLTMHGGAGRIQDVAHARAIVVTDFAPVVATMKRVVDEINRNAGPVRAEPAPLGSEPVTVAGGRSDARSADPVRSVGADVPNPAGIAEDLDPPIEILLSPKGLRPRDLVSLVAARTGSVFVWSDRSRETAEKSVIPGFGALRVPRSRLLHALRALLEPARLVVAPLGSDGPPTYVVLDRNDELVRTSPVAVAEADLPALAHAAGMFVVTTLDTLGRGTSGGAATPDGFAGRRSADRPGNGAHIAEETGRIRQALTSLIGCLTSFGGIQDVPSSGVIFLRGYAPTLEIVRRALDDIRRIRDDIRRGAAAIPAAAAVPAAAGTPEP